MNTLASLMGGLLLMLILYGAFRWVPGLSSGLRALLASSLALVAYFFVILGHWPGLDVVAMHISVFLVSGLLLYMFTQARSHKARIHWVPKILIGFFLLLAGINTFLLYISTRGLPPQLAQIWLPGHHPVNSGFSGVVEHGQDAAKAVSSELNRSYSAAQLGWRIHVAGLDEIAKTQQLVSMRVVDRTGLPVNGLRAELNLMRPGGDHAVSKTVLIEKGAGEYSNLLDITAAGRWLVEMQLTQNGRVVYRESRELTVP